MFLERKFLFLTLAHEVSVSPPQTFRLVFEPREEGLCKGGLRPLKRRLTNLFEVILMKTFGERTSLRQSVCQEGQKRETTLTSGERKARDSSWVRLKPHTPGQNLSRASWFSPFAG